MLAAMAFPRDLRWLAPLLAGLLAACPASKSCPSGQTECGGVCLDFQTSSIACGACLHVCPAGGTCVAGTCECPTGQILCGTACVDPTSNNLNCGACNQPCGTGTCQGGACHCGTTTPCATVQPGDNKVRCADTQKDPANCGACGLACKVGDVCSGAACVCQPPKTDCPAGCFDLSADPAHCGTACPGTACQTGASCQSGVCTCPPTAPTTCGSSPGTCVDLTSDPAHCGTCTTVCSNSGAICSNSSCACPTSHTLCGTACVDLTSSAANCGACGKACGAGQVCLSGICCGGTSFACGSGSTLACCAGGTSCCGGGAGACPIAHQNGLGGTYFSCNALNTWTHDDALAAAASWAAGTTFDGTQCGGPFTLSQQTSTQCATWFYTGSNFPGQVALATSPSCPCAVTTPDAWQ
jgi:hypothetical protein